MNTRAGIVSGAAATAAATACMAVALHVYQATTVHFTSQELLRVDRLVDSGSDGGLSVERHGDLLHPGTTAVQLDPGVYNFRSTHDVTLAVANPAAVKAVIKPQNKDDKPPPPDSVDVRGFDDTGAVAPTLTLITA